MRMRGSVIFVGQSIVVGLVAAFLAVKFWPGLLPGSGPVVEIHEASAPAGNARLPQGGVVSYASAVDRAAPAVVNINTAKVVTVQPADPFFDDPVFRQFFGGQLGRPQKQLETSLGSGVIVSESGYILTNHHVVDGAQQIQVSLRDGRSAMAKVVGSDPEADIAVVRIGLKHLPVITLGDSGKIRVGDVVLAIGNPFGVGQTVTQGIISATGRSQLGINTFENFIQTDAAINPGNSGGALVDAYGNLIGINSAIFTRSGGFQGIGFAIPISFAKEVMEQIIQYGHAVRGWLGIEAQMITPELARALKLNADHGVVVAGVLRNGPAAQAGLRPGDVILSINGKSIDDAHEALMAISRTKPGQVVAMKVRRNGETLELRPTARNRPEHGPGTE